MKKLVFILFLLFFLISILSPKSVEAFDCSLSTNPDPIYTNTYNSATGNLVDRITFTFTFSKNDFLTSLQNSPLGGNLILNLSLVGSGSVSRDLGKISSKADLDRFSSNPIISTYDKGGLNAPLPLLTGDHEAWIEYQDTSGEKISICDKQPYSVLEKASSCNVVADHDGIGDIDSNFWVTVSDIKLAKGFSFLNFVFDNNLDASTNKLPTDPPNTLRVDIPRQFITSTQNDNPPSITTPHKVQVYTANTVPRVGTIKRGDEMCSTTFFVGPRGATPILPFPTPTPTATLTPTPRPTDSDFCKDPYGCGNDCNSEPRCSSCSRCKPTPAPTRRATPKIQIPNLKPLCDQLKDENNFRSKCWECQNKGEIWSAIGCLPTNFSDLINKYVFTTGVGIAGGIAFLYFLYGAFLILTSSGNAEKMEEAKQIITSSLAGLLLIIFSIFLLRTIGFDILKIPGFG